MITIYKDHNGLEVLNDDPRETSRQGHFYTVNFGLKVHGQAPRVPPMLSVEFQYGPVPTSGVNGLTNEALLAILIHRTKILDARFPCAENKRAIADMENALVNFEVRTARRMVRGVEGKLEA